MTPAYMNTKIPGTKRLSAMMRSPTSQRISVFITTTHSTGG